MIRKLFDTKKTLFYSLVISFIGSSIFLSGERSAMFYYFLTIILSVIFSIKLRKIFLISSCVLIAMISSISIKDYEFSKRMFNYTIYEIFPSKSEIRIFSETHQAHYETAIKMFKDKPLIGHGPKTLEKFVIKSNIMFCMDVALTPIIHTCNFIRNRFNWIYSDFFFFYLHFYFF